MGHVLQVVSKIRSTSRESFGTTFFLLFINNITKDLSSNLRLFADHCLLYRVISCEDDIAELQRDLNTLFK